MLQGKNSKIFLNHTLKSYRDSRNIPPLILTSALSWSEWSLSRPGRFMPRKERRYLLNRKVGRAQSRLDVSEARQMPCLRRGCSLLIALWTSCCVRCILWTKNCIELSADRLGGFIQPDSKWIYFILTYLVCSISFCRKFGVLCSSRTAARRLKQIRSFYFTVSVDLGAFANLRKATISFVMSVRPPT
jgi:hypothetical protein